MAASNSSDCGYCRKSRSGQSSKRYSYYANGYSLSPAFYQALIDKCWRRSGTLLYRPNQKRACCPHYTLRLDSTQCRPSRDQRQAVNRFNRFILGEDYTKKAARLYPLSRDQARKRDSTFDLVDRIHEAEVEALPAALQPAHNFQVTLESDNFTQEKFDVFENYQRVVHGEDASSISKKGFQRFLCDSPVRPGVHTNSSGRQIKVGSYHQCYRLDGKLVAVGVLDLLPHAVSAVYFMYHESIHRHQPGKLGALREIALAMEGGYQFWYPGYYIHSCPKMRYKIDYSPQYVLDPETLDWDLLDNQALAIFDSKSYVSLSGERTRSEEAQGNANACLQNVHAENNKEQISEHTVMKAAGEGGNEDQDDSDDNGAEDSVFASDMPGILSLSAMESMDLDHIRVLADHSEGFFETGETVIWTTDSIRDLGSLKSKIAELVATVGYELTEQIVLDFRRDSRQSA
ncbi:arginine-tRNA-protein transferase [Coniella lustricola]|uniref:Arginyl-tRNA--protein transferase 1 n=1 Tax=Coniella lustricola TaxID=2025994 RepID=A0A2T3A3R2_9PEZI|nr:arginine-tRNA-protein transferase [Coniella lustricola]